MNPLEARVAEVIRRHIDEAGFWDGHWFDPDTNAFLICQSMEKGAQVFGKTPDSERLEQMLRDTQSLLSGLRGLDSATARIVTKKMSKPAIAALLMGESVVRPTEIAEGALVELENWIKSVRRQWGMREKASQKRNWKTASIPHATRRVWGRALFFSDVEQSFREIKTNEGREYFHEYTLNIPPRYEREPPGPFGRFLQDIFEVLEQFSVDQMPISASSALRSWRDACLQITQN